MSPSNEAVESRLRDLLQMSDIMNVLLERCERELSGLQPHLRPGFDLVDMSGLGIATFQAYEIHGHLNELIILWGNAE